MKRKDSGRSGIVYSTDPGFGRDLEADDAGEILLPGRQRLRVLLDRAHRKGKPVTLVTGFVGPAESLNALGKLLRVKCGVGGSTKDGEILLQGDLREKVRGLLESEGFVQVRVI
jgi:translation initiation factor 1